MTREENETFLVFLRYEMAMTKNFTIRGLQNVAKLTIIRIVSTRLDRVLIIPYNY